MITPKLIVKKIQFEHGILIVTSFFFSKNRSNSCFCNLGYALIITLTLLIMYVHINFTIIIGWKY